MTKKQLKQAHILRKYIEGLLLRKEAAVALQLSERQISRLAKEMKVEGESALIHKNTGHKPTNATKTEIIQKVLEIRKGDAYTGCNIAHFQELLERNEKIKISYSTLHRTLTGAGITSPKRNRKKIKHRRRKRKASAGELLQIDATPYDWFGTGESFALHEAIDDATGQPTGLYIAQNECLQGYFAIMRHTCLNFGVPLNVYSDKHTIFRSPLTAKKEEAGEEANATQFGRALDELGVGIIYAHSAQAKGRIERLWETLQSRLPVEFRLRNITSIESANEFLANEYIGLYSQTFGVEPEQGSIFIPYNHRENIDDILCVKEERQVDSAGVFSYKSVTFKVLDEGYPLIPSKAKIDVLINMQGSIRVRYKGRVYGTTIHAKSESAKSTKRSKKSIPVLETSVKPHLVHGSDEWKKVWHYESYAETLAFIYEIFLKPSA